MSVLAVLTLVVIGLLVVALAVSLIAIMVQLRRVLRTRGKVNGGRRVMVQRVEPLEPILAEVNGDLAAVRDRLTGVLERHEQRV